MTTNAYDAYCQPDWTDAPGNYRTDFTYTARGDLVSVADPNGTRTDYSYNDRRQITRIVSDPDGPDQAREDRSYDNQGRLWTRMQPADQAGQRVLETVTYTATDQVQARSLANETTATTDDRVAMPTTHATGPMPSPMPRAAPWICGILPTAQSSKCSGPAIAIRPIPTMAMTAYSAKPTALRPVARAFAMERRPPERATPLRAIRAWASDAKPDPHD